MHIKEAPKICEKCVHELSASLLNSQYHKSRIHCEVPCLSTTDRDLW